MKVVAWVGNSRRQERNDVLRSFTAVPLRQIQSRVGRFIKVWIDGKRSRLREVDYSVAWGIKFREYEEASWLARISRLTRACHVNACRSVRAPWAQQANAIITISHMTGLETRTFSPPVSEKHKGNYPL